MKRIAAKTVIFISTLFAALLIGTLLAPKAHAADARLYFSPSSSTVSLNGTISVSVMLDTGSEDVLGVTADFTYPQDKLTVTAISSTGTVFGVIAENDYTTTAGKVFISQARQGGEDAFNGIGKVTTITFKSKASGSAALSFTTDAALTDENGADIPSFTQTNGAITVGELPDTAVKSLNYNIIFVSIIALLFVLVGLAGIIQYHQDKQKSKLLKT